MGNYLCKASIYRVLPQPPAEARREPGSFFTPPHSEMPLREVPHTRWKVLRWFWSPPDREAITREPVINENFSYPQTQTQEVGSRAMLEQVRWFWCAHYTFFQTATCVVHKCPRRAGCWRLIAPSAGAYLQRPTSTKKTHIYLDCQPVDFLFKWIKVKKKSCFLLHPLLPPSTTAFLRSWCFLFGSEAAVISLCTLHSSKLLNKEPRRAWWSIQG